VGTKGDLCLLERAVKQRWLTDPLKPAAMQAIQDAMDSPDIRVRIRAAKILADMESQNQKDEHKIVDVNVATRHDHLSSIAADLGIEIGAIQDAAREASAGIGGPDAANPEGSE
jgi:hypothetical protein